jgi:hypothetical protein
MLICRGIIHPKYKRQVHLGPSENAHFVVLSLFRVLSPLFAWSLTMFRCFREEEVEEKRKKKLAHVARDLVEKQRSVWRGMV